MFSFGKPKIEKMKSRGDIQGLIKALGYQKDKDSKEIRCAAVKALGELKDAQAVTPLTMTLLNDEHPHVRECAAQALGKLGDVRAVEALITTLEKKIERDYVRCAAAEALGALGDTRAVEPLVSVLNVWEISQTAAKALERLGWQPKQDESAVRYWLAKEEWQKCAALGQVAIETLIAVLKRSAEIGAFAQSMLSLNLFSGCPDFGFFGQMEGMKCMEMREAAAKVLVEIGAPAIPPLLAALEDESVWMRMTIAWVLGEMRDARAVEPLANLLRNKDLLQDKDCSCECPQQAVLEALIKIGTPSIEALTALGAQVEDREMRRSIMEALDNLRKKTA